MYHQVILVGNRSFSNYFEYRHGVLVEFDIEKMKSLILQGDEFQYRMATDDETKEIILSGK